MFGDQYRRARIYKLYEHKAKLQSVRGKHSDAVQRYSVANDANLAFDMLDYSDV